MVFAFGIIIQSFFYRTCSTAHRKATNSNSTSKNALLLSSARPRMNPSCMKWKLRSSTCSDWKIRDKRYVIYDSDWSPILQIRCLAQRSENQGGTDSWKGQYFLFYVETITSLEAKCKTLAAASQESTLFRQQSREAVNENQNLQRAMAELEESYAYLHGQLRSKEAVSSQKVEEL